MSAHTKLWLCSLTPEQKARTCGYWYVVTDGASPHTAFQTRAALTRWLELCGLSLSAALPPEGEYSSARLVGTYAKEVHLSYDEFWALNPIVEARALSNGEWTLARITEEGGIRTVHTLNPNCRHRPKFDYTESRNYENAGIAA